MKIALINDDYPPHHAGGAGAVVSSLAQGYCATGHEMLVVTAVHDHALAGDTTEGVVRVRRIYSPHYHERWRAFVSLYRPRMVRAVAAALRDFAPDVVHIHNVHRDLSYGVFRAARKISPKVFMTAHDCMSFTYGKFTSFINRDSVAIPEKFSYRVSPISLLRAYSLRYNPLRNIIIRRRLRGTGGTIAVSDALRQALQENGIRVRAVIGNGVDSAKWEVPREETDTFRARHALVGKKVVLFVGARTDAKGWPQTRAAMVRVLERVPEAVLAIAGRGDAAESPFVVPLGWLSGGELCAAYATADVVVQPSLCLETFGLTALEGMAAGKPVVGTCFGGVPEVVEDGVTGFIVNPLDTNAFAETLVRLLSDEDLAHKMGEAGRRRAAERFSLARQIDEYLALFQS